MIIYNGIALESIAPVMIEDIRVSPIKYNPVTRARAIQFGSEFVRMRGGERTIAITFALFDDNRITRHQAMMNVYKWAKTDEEHKLILPFEPFKYLKCICTAKPEPSVRQWWESKLRIVFTCIDDPFWNSNEEKSVACGTQFNVLGDAPPRMRIERTLASSASDQSYSLNGNTITFSSIPAGNMVIDLDKQTAVVGSSSIMGNYNVNSRFLVPRTGLQTVTGTGTVKYCERWQ
jgi:phage-related protein